MTTSRSFARLAVTGFFVQALAIACVVSNSDQGDGGDACEPGDTAACTCTNGTKSTKECNASGTGYLLCECAGVGSGGAGSGGGAPGSGGDSQTTAGTNANPVGGADTGAGGANLGAGGADIGAGGADIGAGGVENVPAACQSPADTCEECYYAGCCVEWAACEADNTCVDELVDILACTDAIRVDRSVTTADLVVCAEDAGAGSGSWSEGVSALTKGIVDCIAGEPGWEGSPWGANSCNNSCFKK